MNQYVPDWNLEVDFGQHGGILPKASQKNPVCRETELVELLWQNGHLVMHSQNNQKTSALRGEFKSIQEEEPINLIQADQMAPWFQNSIYDSLEKDFDSQLFSEMAAVNTTCAGKMNTEVYAKDERCIEVGSTRESNVLAGSAPCQSTLHLQDIVTMPLQKSQGFDALNYFDLLRPLTAKLDEKESGSGATVGQNSSRVTNGSSICGSSQIHAKADLSGTDVSGVAGESKEGAGICFPIQSEQKHAYEITFPSSSGGTGFCTRSTGIHGGISGCQKRKQREVDGLEDQSENVDEFLDAKKPRRSRAAEIHNRSERKRRDRINERMKALQELIPHCNKTDKASLLDEAIEYLKSLQLQLQIMWTRSRMAQMMYPGVQQYMSGMGMGLAHASVPSMHHAVQLPSVLVVNQSVGSSSGTNQALFYPSPALHATDLQNLMQSSHCKESHAPCPAFHHLHPHSQVMHQCALGSFILQQSQQTATPSSSSRPSSGKGPCENNTHDSESG